MGVWRRKLVAAAGRLLLAGALLPAGGCDARRGAAAPRIRIMPLGDSITQGTAEQGSYRRPLWKMLKGDGFRADFVGSQALYDLRRSPERDFDADHEGHSGWRSDQIAERADEWARDSQPDIVLLHIGTNDVGGGRTPREICRHIRRIVDAFRHRNPRVRFLIAQIIPFANPTARAAVARLNEELAPFAASLGTSESPVVVVDQFTDFDPARLTVDGMHPNVEGNQEMASRWFAALAAMLRGADDGAGRHQ